MSTSFLRVASLSHTPSLSSLTHTHPRYPLSLSLRFPPASIPIRVSHSNIRSYLPALERERERVLMRVCVHALAFRRERERERRRAQLSEKSDCVKKCVSRNVSVDLMARIQSDSSQHKRLSFWISSVSNFSSNSCSSTLNRKTWKRNQKAKRLKRFQSSWSFRASSQRVQVTRSQFIGKKCYFYSSFYKFFWP